MATSTAHPGARPSPEEQVYLAQQGDEDAFASIISDYMPVVKAKTRDLSVQGVERDDLIQEGLIGLMRAVHSYSAEQGASFATYADRCISNQLNSAIRAALRRKNAPLNDYIPIDSGNQPENASQWEEPVSSAASVEEAVIGKERLDSILDIIYRRLSKFERQVLQRYIDGKSYQDIANELRCTVKSVDNAIWRLKKKMS